MSPRPALLAVSVLAAAALPLVPVAPAAASAAAAVTEVARDSAPVVLTGAQIPAWSRSAATGVGEPYPSGASVDGTGLRSAHNGVLAVPPDTRTGVDPGQVTAYRWTGADWQEVPVQVDQRFPNFLANGHSTFSIYSGTDQELTYAWNPDGHSVGEEAWKKVFGECSARYATSEAEVAAARQAGVVGYGPQEDAASYLGPMADPVPTLDDEIALMARDAGPAAPLGQAGPAGTSDGQAVAVTDPVDPTNPRFVYLFLRAGGSSFTAATGYVQHTRAANADEWIDRYSFRRSDPEVVGVSNTNYGPNLKGAVCRTSPDNDANPKITAADGAARPSTDRGPRDGMAIETPTYALHASGRWMVRSYQVTAPGAQRAFGPDLISRWKGRAFQQSPDSSVSLVGFEDEQVNWEQNAAELGWRSGPVRAIREIWGADSGTNVTRTETYYRDADVYRYHVRVHPIPPDGLYTSWDYNPGAVTRYYNLERPNGVAIDGVNDDSGNIDEVPVSGQPAFTDVCDPTFDVCSAVDRPEEVAGPHGGMVYVFEFKGATSAVNAEAIPYYRDDACLDDGTGDAPLPRPWPGEASTDQRTKDGYVDYWKAHGAPATLTYADLKCDPTADPATTVPWQREPFVAAFGQHGIHFLTTADSDNGTAGVPVTEIDGQQWRFAVPMSAPTNVLTAYGANVVTPLQEVVTPFGTSADQPAGVVPEAPYAVLLPLGGLLAALGLVARRRRPVR